MHDDEEEEEEVVRSDVGSVVVVAGLSGLVLRSVDDVKGVD